MNTHGRAFDLESAVPRSRLETCGVVNSTEEPQRDMQAKKGRKENALNKFKSLRDEDGNHVNSRVWT